MADAVVSGPGAYSRRTDAQGGQPIRSLPDPKYGEAQAFEAQQKGAPLADASAGTPKAPYPSDIASADAGGPAPAAPAEPAEPLPALFDPGHPDVPMTSGAPVGAGPNVLPGLRASTLRDQMEKYVVADPTGVLASLANSLSERGW